MKSFQRPDSKIYYFSGISEGQLHTLTFWSDSVFHITVPNNSGSCFNWGEFGGTWRSDGDTIGFKFDGSNKHQEVFLVRNNVQLIKISK